MKGKKLILGLGFVVVAIVGWALFRPERLFVNTKVNESIPATSGSQSVQTAIAAGKFHSGAHKGSGDATIYQLGDGKRVLRLTNFETSNGPDVRVYLVAANDVTDSETVKKAGFVEVAPLKGNVGDQNYELASDVNLTKYRAVTIWCKRFSVNFATAPLATIQSTASN